MSQFLNANAAHLANLYGKNKLGCRIGCKTPAPYSLYENILEDNPHREATETYFAQLGYSSQIIHPEQACNAGKSTKYWFQFLLNIGTELHRINTAL